MKLRVLAALAWVPAALSLSTPAAAQFAKPEDAIQYRQSALLVLGQHFTRLGAMANGRVPFDAKLAQENADVVAAMARLPWAAFEPGTDKGAPHKARPAVWAEPAKFKEHADKLVAQSTQLAAAARTGSLDAVKTSFSATAASCKACHDAYRDR